MRERESERESERKKEKIVFDVYYMYTILRVILESLFLEYILLCLH